MEKVMICGVCTPENEATFSASMEELASLVATAQGEVVATIIQNRPQIDSKTIVGKGKLMEIQRDIMTYDVDTIIFNQGLTPRQAQNIESITEIKVIDRIQLILHIFAMRAKSKAGQLQVEKAQIDYLLPRLSNNSVHLSRQGAGIGTRGPGETKLETDRRHLRQRQTKIKKELADMAEQRELNRKQRTQQSALNIGLIGYTNAGKSTILNQLTDANTYEQDELFATLDPLTKQMTLPCGLKATVTDTVGFIQDLPTTLIDAFHSTLEESRHMDLLLHVVDSHSKIRELQEETVLQLVQELKMDHIPMVTIYNKKDLTHQFMPTLFPFVFVSAKDEDSKENIQDAIMEQLKTMWIPYDVHLSLTQSHLIAPLKQQSLLTCEQFDEDTMTYHLVGYAPEHLYWLWDIVSQGKTKENEEV